MSGSFQRSEMHRDDVLKELSPWVMGVVVQYLIQVGSIKETPRTKAHHVLVNNVHSHCLEVAWQYIHSGIGPGGNCSDLACDIALRAGKIFGKYKKEPSAFPVDHISPSAGQPSTQSPAMQLAPQPVRAAVSLEQRSTENPSLNPSHFDPNSSAHCYRSISGAW